MMARGEREEDSIIECRAMDDVAVVVVRSIFQVGKIIRDQIAFYASHSSYAASFLNIIIAAFLAPPWLLLLAVMC